MNNAPSAADQRDVSGFRLWFDTEYTGLELDSARLLQVALMITDASGRRLEPPANDVRLDIRLPDGAPVSDWLKQNLPDLLARCRSAGAVETGEADRCLAEHVLRVLGPLPARSDRRPVLAGNSLHADWRLAERWLPRFAACLNYRHLDVTALKLIWRERSGGEEFRKEDPAELARYFPEADVASFAGRHDAYYDVQASLAELNYYRERLLRPPA